jgi:hypothetical protein
LDIAESTVIDDLLAGIFGEVALGGVGRSKRAQLVLRLFFGLLGAGLGLAGAASFALRANPSSNAPMHASIIAMFLSLAAFSLFNVALARSWRWPGMAFVGSFIALFATRILFGP